ncbi:MAG: NAD(P)/FAD-dependent oxidoreductase [Rubrivivax sp.]
MDSVEAVVVGAGVVGLACARSLALAGHEVLLLEAGETFGSATSARNSEVLHAGLYYPPGSLKARLCVAGHAALAGYAAERGVALQHCGKLIVATRAGQEAALQAIQDRAAACGVHTLRWLDGAAARAMEPALGSVTAALWSPQTGIVDSHALMLALLGEAQDHGAVLACRAPLDAARSGGGGFELVVGGVAPLRLRTRWLVNAAGLHAQAVARCIDGLDARHVPAAHWARGCYFTVPGRAAFSRLIYPLPEPGGLGVHVTLDLAGQMRFGPDVEWVAVAARGAEDYRVDPARAPAFEASIRGYWPGLPAASLQPAYAGLRPKVSGPGAPAGDFMIDGPAVHGLPGLVNLFGIESPGLTASLAIGAHVAAQLAEADGA